jgi:hypothetical protein
VGAHFVDGQNVGVIEVGRGLGLRPEALHVAATGILARQDQLDGHDPAQAHLPSAVDHAHAATGDLGKQFVIAEILDRVK